MKAIIYTQYGSPDVLQLKDVDKPTPKDNEVLVKIHAASVNAYDWHLMTADIFLVRLAMGLFKPKHPILGADVAGRVEAVGAGVTAFQPGDEVFGDLSRSGNGGFAEYVCAREDSLVLKPTNLSFEQAAAVPMAAMTALQGLRDLGGLQAGQQVVINGASGGVGTFAVQIARVLGAEVTAVCSTTKMEMVRSLGADHVIDYTKEDFTKSGRQYDLIYAANGYHPILDYRRALKPGGTYVMAGGHVNQMFEALLLGALVSRGGTKMAVLTAKPNKQDLAYLGELLQAGKVVPVMDKCYPLHQAAEAMRQLGAGHARGKIVVSPTAS